MHVYFTSQLPAGQQETCIWKDPSSVLMAARSRVQAQVLDWEPLLIFEGSMSMRILVKGASPCIYLTVNMRRIKTWLPVGMLQVSCGRTTRGCCKGRAVGGSLCGQLHQCPLNAPLEYVLTANGNFSSHIHHTGVGTLGPGWPSSAGKEESPGLGVCQIQWFPYHL